MQIAIPRDMGIPQAAWRCQGAALWCTLRKCLLALGREHPKSQREQGVCAVAIRALDVSSARTSCVRVGLRRSDKLRSCTQSIQGGLGVISIWPKPHILLIFFLSVVRLDLEAKSAAFLTVVVWIGLCLASQNFRKFPLSGLVRTW